MARYFDRDPRTTSKPTEASLTARPLPAGPVAPSTPICIRTLWSRPTRGRKHRTALIARGDVQAALPDGDPGATRSTGSCSHGGVEPAGNQTCSCAPSLAVADHRLDEQVVDLTRVAPAQPPVGPLLDGARHVFRGQLQAEPAERRRTRLVVHERDVRAVLVERQAGRVLVGQSHRRCRDDPVVDVIADPGRHQDEVCGPSKRPDPVRDRPDQGIVVDVDARITEVVGIHVAGPQDRLLPRVGAEAVAEAHRRCRLLGPSPGSDRPGAALGRVHPSGPVRPAEDHPHADAAVRQPTVEQALAQRQRRIVEMGRHDRDAVASLRLPPSTSRLL